MSVQQVARAIHDAPSELVAARVLCTKGGRNVLGLRLRPLTRQETSVMENRGCHCEAWADVLVGPGFDPFRVAHVTFHGVCAVGALNGKRELEPGLCLPCGISHCTLDNCQVGDNCLLQNVRFAVNAVIEAECTLFDVGSLTCSGGATFGCGQRLPLACETGGRELPVWAEVKLPEAAAVVRDRGDRTALDDVFSAVDDYTRKIRSDVTWVRRGSVIKYTMKVSNTYIGEYAYVDHVQIVDNCCLLSAKEECTRLTEGIIVKDSVLQWGSSVSGKAIVRNCVMLEYSGVSDNGVVTESLLGPNTVISKGEVTASLVGPFIGFHHQSLLISAFWPEGKGNIAHGAKVGSNHTSRAPDQEVWPGEGTFFGLGCSIRFPADFSQAPYCTVATGVSTLPQRIAFPFSLVRTPEGPISDDGGQLVPRAFNEIIPGWGLDRNAYGMARTEMKFAKRDQARRHCFDHKVLRPDILQLVRAGLHSLQNINVSRSTYVGKDLPGIGKNFMREEERQRGITAYQTVIKRFALRVLLTEAESSSRGPTWVRLAHELADLVMPNTTLRERLEELVIVEKRNTEMVFESKAQDDVRGASITPGYSDAHVCAGNDPVVLASRDRLRRTELRVVAVLDNLK